MDVSQVHVLEVVDQLCDYSLLLRAALDPLEEAGVLLVEVVFTADAFHRHADLLY